MDPYDLPSSTNVKKCLVHWGTRRFADCFLSTLQENEDDLPLQDMCISGGYPSTDDSAEVSDLQLDEENGQEVTGSVYVSFTEESPTGCRDMQWKDKRRGRIDFTLDLSTGEVEFESPRQIREYDKDEF